MWPRCAYIVHIGSCDGVRHPHTATHTTHSTTHIHNTARCKLHTHKLTNTHAHTRLPKTQDLYLGQGYTLAKNYEDQGAAYTFEYPAAWEEQV